MSMTPQSPSEAAGRGWLRWEVVVRYKEVTPHMRREDWEEIDRSRYPWKWLAHLLNPIGTHLHSTAIGPMVIDFRLVDRSTPTPDAKERE
jgi:hypothetical protein